MKDGSFRSLKGCNCSTSSWTPIQKNFLFLDARLKSVDLLGLKN